MIDPLRKAIEPAGSEMLARVTITRILRAFGWMGRAETRKGRWWDSSTPQDGQPKPTRYATPMTFTRWADSPVGTLLLIAREGRAPALYLSTDLKAVGDDGFYVPALPPAPAVAPVAVAKAAPTVPPPAPSIPTSPVTWMANRPPPATGRYPRACMLVARLASTERFPDIHRTAQAVVRKFWVTRQDAYHLRGALGG